MEQTGAQVRAAASLEVMALSLPHFIDHGSTPHHSYQNLSQYLRTNIFPGAPVAWMSICKDSFVSHRPTDRAVWFGHSTDEVVQWTERNIIHHKLNKKLMEKKTTSK